LDLIACTATRPGKPVAYFGGRQRAWKMFLLLCDRRGLVYTTARDLVACVWNPNQRRWNKSTDAALAQPHVTALRKLLRPLGLKVTHDRDKGYRLSEI
jgi:hypothetical protein